MNVQCFSPPSIYIHGSTPRSRSDVLWLAFPLLNDVLCVLFSRLLSVSWSITCVGSGSLALLEAAAAVSRGVYTHFFGLGFGDGASWCPSWPFLHQDTGTLRPEACDPLCSLSSLLHHPSTKPLSGLSPREQFFIPSPSWQPFPGPLHRPGSTSGWERRPRQ